MMRPYGNETCTDMKVIHWAKQQALTLTLSVTALIELSCVSKGSSIQL